MQSATGADCNISENSDLDLLVDFDKNINLLEITGMERELSETLGIKVDLVTVESLNERLKPYITSDLIRIRNKDWPHHKKQRETINLVSLCFLLLVNPKFYPVDREIAAAALMIFHFNDQAVEFIT